MNILKLIYISALYNMNKTEYLDFTVNSDDEAD